MPSNGLTPTQNRMLRVLSDGLPHGLEDLRACLYDDTLGSKHNVRTQISNLRKKLRPHGEDIVCEFWRRRFVYRHVRIVRGDSAIRPVV